MNIYDDELSLCTGLDDRSLPGMILLGCQFEWNKALVAHRDYLSQFTELVREGKVHLQA